MSGQLNWFRPPLSLIPSSSASLIDSNSLILSQGFFHFVCPIKNCTFTLEWWDAVLQKRLTWAFFVMFSPTLARCQAGLIPPPPPGSKRRRCGPTGGGLDAYRYRGGWYLVKLFKEIKFQISIIFSIILGSHFFYLCPPFFHYGTKRWLKYYTCCTDRLAFFCFINYIFTVRLRDAVLQKRLAWALFVLCSQPCVLSANRVVLGLFFNFPVFYPPPPQASGTIPVWYVGHLLMNIGAPLGFREQCTPGGRLFPSVLCLCWLQPFFFISHCYMYLVYNFGDTPPPPQALLSPPETKYAEQFINSLQLPVFVGTFSGSLGSSPWELSIMLLSSRCYFLHWCVTLEMLSGNLCLTFLWSHVHAECWLFREEGDGCALPAAPDGRDAKSPKHHGRPPRGVWWASQSQAGWLMYFTRQ